MIDIDKQLDLFKETYYKQLEQKELINSRISIPVGILSLLCGGVLYFLLNIKNIHGNICRITFFFFLASFSISILTTIAFLFKAYYGYTYAYLATPKEIDTYIKDTRKYYDNEKYYFNVNREKAINEDIENFLYDQYVECSNINSECNKTKLIYLNKAGWCIIISLFLGIMSLIPYSISLINNTDEAQKVKIVNIKDLQKGDTKIMDKSQNKPSKNTTTSTSNTKPQRPSIQLLKENFSLEPTKKTNDGK